MVCILLVLFLLTGDIDIRLLYFPSVHCLCRNESQSFFSPSDTSLIPVFEPKCRYGRRRVMPSTGALNTDFREHLRISTEVTAYHSKGTRGPPILATVNVTNRKS